MSRTASKATVLLNNGNLHFTQAGVYTIEYLPSGNVQIKLDGGKATVLKPGDYAGITSFSFAPGATIGSPIRIDGVTFTEAGPAGPFEINLNLNNLLGTLITSQGIAWTVDNLVINGNKADTFKVLWDYLDDAYVAGNNFFNVALNETFVRLGAEYIEYLAAGGAPLTDITVKFAADNNMNGIPQREQSMHDNLLGNVNASSIADRQFGSPLEGQLLALIPQEYQDRPYYSGNEDQVGGAAHDAVRAFDWEKGWSRPDYFDRFLGKVDPIASDDRNNDSVDEQMFYGTGNSNDFFNIVRHEGAGVELALKAKEFGPNGGDYGPANRSYDVNGVLHYQVSTGASPDNANRADWSLDYAATVLPQGADESWTFKLFIDLDETSGVNFAEIPMTVFGGLLQGSSNYGFNFIRGAIDVDDGAPGVQPYAFGVGEFDILLQAYAGGDLIASNHIVVHVGP
jgi:hypothetical protein